MRWTVSSVLQRWARTQSKANLLLGPWSTATSMSRPPLLSPNSFPCCDCDAKVGTFTSLQLYSSTTSSLTVSIVKTKKKNLSQVLVSEFGLFLCYFCFLLFAFVWFKWCLSACVTILFCFCVVFCDMCSSRQRICALQTWNCLRVRTRCLLRVRKVRLFQRENSKFYNLIFLSKKRNALPALSGKLLLVSIVNKKI